jgi:hypothetical protein
LKSFGEAKPSPAASPKPKPKPKASPSPAKAAPAPDPYYSADDPYGFDEEPVPRRGNLPAAEEDEEFIPRQTVKPVSGKPRKKKKAGGSSFESIPGWAYLVCGGVFVAMLIGAVFSKAVAGILMILVLLASLIMMVVGSIGLLVVPFFESVVCGLMALFVPFYGLYYVITRWDDMKKWFLLNLVGVGMLFGCGIFLPAIAAARQAAERARQQQEMQRGGFVMQDGPANDPRFPGGRPPFGVHPAFPPPEPVNAAEQVTLNVSGLVDKDTADVFYEKLDALRNSFSGGNGGRRSSGSGGRAVCVVWPIKDVQAFANGIDFARVTNVSGRTIDVTVEPLDAGQRRPADSDVVAQVLFDLKSAALDRRKDALRKLREAPPDPSRREEVAKAIEPLLHDPDGFAASDAAKALAVWGGPENTPALVEALKDSRFNVVWAALDTMKALHDPAAAEPVAALLAENKNRGKVAEVLKAMGPDAQAAVVPLLDHDDVFVRMEACKILAVIGTTDETRMAIMNLYRRVNGHGLDAMAADDAIKRIGKPKVSPFRKKSIIPR